VGSSWATPAEVEAELVRRRRRHRGWYVAGFMSLVLTATLADMPALARPLPGGWEPPPAPDVTGVQVREIPPDQPSPYGAAGAVVTGTEPVRWPAAGTERVALAAGPASRSAPAGDLPVRVAAAAGGPDAVTVRVADRAETAAAGVAGVLLEIGRADGGQAAGRVDVDVDYSGFRGAYGGGWSSRLRFHLLTGCGEPTPVPAPVVGLDPVDRATGGAGCDASEPLPTSNDHQAGVLSATVPLPSGGGIATVSVSSAPEGENGDYTATSLKPAATWNVAAQTGAFSWDYPLRMVPGVGGPEPTLSLTYSSQSVDGLTANTNTQGSWIGDGWDLWPGYIERQYRSCSDDTDPVGGQDPNNDEETPTGDKCWFNHNASMSLNGSATELVDDGGGRYRPASDDGSRIELLTDTGLGNGDNNGEYWKVTTTDGSQYFFGRHRRPAYPSDGAATNSTWTMPVYGNHPGEPCYEANDFPGSRCTQAWRWNLDYIVDPHGNSMSLFYTRETGAYGREADPDKRTTYHRGGYLTRIEYGTRTGTEHTQPVAAQVVFDTADRCKPGATCSSSNPSAWPDTPWDQHCHATPCTDQLAPTFWTQKRLTKVRAQVWRGSSFSDVESWTLRHEYLDAGATDGEGIPMWLRGITRTGHVTTAGGAAVSDPEITFDPGGMPLANRVDGPSDGRTQLFRWRVRTIHTETGAEIGISYSGHDCTSSTLPSPHTNGKRCYPQWYAPEGFEPTLDWFHKYVVTRVDIHDTTGASAHQQTNYDYLDNPAWHYDDSELVDKDKRTWGQWRGYSKVRVRKGLQGQGTESATEYLYLRGMHGDRASPSGGTKSVQVTDSQGTAITDHEAHAGFLREETLRNGPGGGWVSGSIHDPWRHGPTATAGPLKAWLTNTGTTRERTALAGGGTRWTKRVSEFDTTYGMVTQVDDLGNEATSADNRCTRYEYARNTSKWLVDSVSRTETVGVRCSETPDRPEDVLSDSRTFYDNPTTHGAAPTRGLVVKEQEVGSWSGSTPVWVTTTRTSYDSNGRPVEVFDELDRQTTTAYTPAVNGPVTATAATNELGYTVTSAMEPAWQLATRTTDANGLVTDLTYDGLGRLTEVWLPGRAKASQTGNLQFEYLVRDDAPSAVTTRKLLPTGSSYQTSISLFDGQLRERQTQTQSPAGGRAIVDTIYDSRGLTESVSKEYYDTTNDPPDTTLVGSGQPQTPGITEYEYDGAERVTDEIFLALGSEAWRTSYSYGGDRTHATPPEGGTATTQITDARGNLVALRQYHGPTPTGGYDETTYTYTRRDERASVTDEVGNTWTFTYDQRGREISSTDPDKGTTTTTYDAAGQVVTETDARGLTLGYTYDPLGRRTSIREGSPTGPKRAEWIYDTLANGKGELTRSIRYDGGAQYVSEVTGYDAAGRATGTRAIVPASETGLDGTYPMTTMYRPDGSISATQLPAIGGLPSEFLIFAYNDVGAPTWLTSSLTSYVREVSYNQLGELVQRELGPFGKRTQVTYTIDEPTGRLVNTAVLPELQPEAMELSYQYDDMGNLLRIADTPGSSVVDTQCYEYDHLRRLAQAWTPAATGPANCEDSPTVGALGGVAPYWHSWSYDPTGNRLSQTRHAGGGDTVTTYDHPAAGGTRPHAVTSAATVGPGLSTLDTYGYDPAGNLTERVVGGDTQTLAWDDEGNLESVTEGSEVTSFVYDADGNRLIRRDAEGKTLYLPGGQELRYDNATGTRICTRYYTHIDTLVAIRTPTELTWVVGDHHNTAEAMIRHSDLQVSRKRTLPFGETRGAQPSFWAGDKGFVGGTEDPTGLVHLGARLYDQALGRFISVDPAVDFEDPQRAHAYAYGNNAPPTFTDPQGLFFKKLWDKGKSAVNTATNIAENVGNAVASGVQTAAKATADWAVNTVNTIKEDPWKFAAEVAVGVAVAVAVGAVCSTGVGCVILVGAVAGAAAAGAGYGVDVAQGDREFSAKDLATEMVIGGAVGAATGGLGAGASRFGRQAINGFRKGGQSCRINSFVPGTAVVMADGTSQPIENVALGDQVLATDPETGETSAEDVVATITGTGEKVLVDITVDAGTDLPGDGAALVTATAGHPFWVPGLDAWLPVIDLRPGLQLETSSGATAQVVAVQQRSQPGTVYNLTVANLHTFYVRAGAGDILTHNCAAPMHRKPDPYKARHAQYLGKHHKLTWSERLRLRANEYFRPQSTEVARTRDIADATGRVAETAGQAVGREGWGPLGQAAGTAFGWAANSRVVSRYFYKPKHSAPRKPPPRASGGRSNFAI
jgi:RHS repeat-associated protein